MAAFMKPVRYVVNTSRTLSWGGGHSDRLKARFADGHLTVIGHHSQQESLNVSKRTKTEELSGTFIEWNDWVLCPEIYEYFRGNDRRVTEVNKGQVTEEKIHWHVEM